MRHERGFAPATHSAHSPLVDGFGRQVTYLRLSVTDRCDLRCVYCMSEQMAFLPRREVLTLEELYRLACVFMRGGVRKIRLTGGEPLVRRNVMQLFELLAPHLDDGDLDEVTLTTNGTLLSRHAGALFAAGVRRVNVSLDTLDADRYAQITRRGRLQPVLDGIDAALAAGLRVKINTVAMSGAFEEEVDDLIHFAHRRGMDLTLIEEMPLGNTGHDRSGSFLSLQHLRRSLEKRWTLVPVPDRSGGPARYVQVAETNGRLGFITPLSCDFCASCNRVRVSCTGDLFTCLGQEGAIGLRDALRGSGDLSVVDQLIRGALSRKPKGHTFDAFRPAESGIGRHMSVLGG